MNNNSAGIFENVRFLNEFDLKNLFKKKEKKQSNFDPLDPEEEKELLEKCKKFLDKHKSGFKKTFDSVMKDSKWSSEIKKYKFDYNTSDLSYVKESEYGDGYHDPRGFFAMSISRLNLWDVKDNLRQAHSEGDPLLDELYKLENEYVKAMNKYCDDNKIGFVFNAGDWDDYVHELAVSVDHIKFLEL